MAADKNCAERIRQSIIQNFTYEDIENETAISVSTLKRLASGEREPKLVEIRKIAKATGKNPVWLAFGESSFSPTDNSNKKGYTVDMPLHGYGISGDVAKTRLIAAIRDSEPEDIAFLEKFIDLLNLDRTINSVKSKKYNVCEQVTQRSENRGKPR